MSFFQQLINLLAGDTGRSLIGFYNENSAVINTFVFIYGLVVVFAHRNLRKIIIDMEKMMVDITAEMGESIDYSQVYKEFQRRWEHASEGKRIFLPSRTDLWFNLIPRAQLIDLLFIQKDYMKVALNKLTGKPKAKTFNPTIYRTWDEYRKRLFTGLRTRVKDPQEIFSIYEAEERKGRK